MVMADVITLVSEDPGAHGVFDAPTRTERTVFVTIKSVGYREVYEAMAHGLNPTLVFTLALAADYQDETLCVYDGKEYNIIRTYLTKSGGIELTAERRVTKDA